MKVAAIVGMSGAGKSEVAKVFVDKGFTRIRFGDLTENEVVRRGLDINEANERQVREQLRKEHGMAAYAKLNLPLIDETLKHAPVVVDGMYSWEEYKLMKEHYGDKLITIAVYSSPETRQVRLQMRKIRPLSLEESLSRDVNEIENLNKGGPIAMADYTLINEISMYKLKKEVEQLICSF